MADRGLFVVSRTIVMDNGEEQRVTHMKSLVGQLDFEIERLSSGATKTGITHWTLLAAFAATLWLLMDELERSTPLSEGIVVVFLILSLAHTTWTCIRPLFSPGTSVDGDPVRFFRAHILLGTIRLPMLVRAIRMVTIAVAAGYLAHHLSLWSPWVIVVIYAIAFLVLVIGVVVACFGFPVPASSGKPWIAFPATSTLVVLVLLGMVDPVRAMFSGHIGIAVSDLRMGSLAFTASLLVQWFADSALKSDWPCDLLLRIRRDLMFGEMSLQTARERIQTTLLGERVRDILGPQVDRILDLQQRSVVALRSATKILASSEEFGADSLPSEEHRRLIMTYVTEVDSIVDEMLNGTAKFTRRANLVKALAPRSAPEVLELRESLVAQVKVLKHELNGLQEKLCELKKPGTNGMTTNPAVSAEGHEDQPSE